MRTTVVTAALRSRLHLLAEAVASVTAQIHQPVAHLIGVDHAREGSAAVRNRLAFAADTEWVSFLDDDDMFYRNHLAVHAQRTDADLVYSYCDVIGREGWNPNRPFDADALRAGNFIPVTVSIRRDLFRWVNGFRPAALCAHGWEDHDLWLRLLDLGARFVCVPVVTWQYRFFGGNKTYHGEGKAT